MKKRAFNDMLGKGFDSAPQEAFLWMLYERGCIGQSQDGTSTWDYEWVPEVWARHGHSDGPWKGFPANDPCVGSAHMIRGLVALGMGLERHNLKKAASIIRDVLAQIVLQPKRVVTADYLDSIRERSHGQYRRPFTSVEEALTNFSQRLGLDTLTKQALKKQLIYKLGIDALEQSRADDLDDALMNPALAEQGLGLDPDDYATPQEYERAKKRHRLRMEQKRELQRGEPAVGDNQDLDGFDLQNNAPVNTVNTL